MLIGPLLATVSADAKLAVAEIHGGWDIIEEGSTCRSFLWIFGMGKWFRTRGGGERS